VVSGTALITSPPAWRAVICPIACCRAAARRSAARIS